MTKQTEETEETIEKEMEPAMEPVSESVELDQEALLAGRKYSLRAVMYKAGMAAWRRELRAEEKVSFLDKDGEVREGTIVVTGIAHVGIQLDGSDQRMSVPVDDVLLVHRWKR